MKIRTISRTEEDYTRKSKLDITKVIRNRDPVIHPFEKAREYTRAVTATKLEKIFAKPFIGAMDGHRDSVNVMCCVRNRPLPLLSGGCDGEIRVWDLMRRETVWSVSGAHRGFVRGLATAQDGNSFFSCGDDRMIKHWSLSPDIDEDDDGNSSILPLSTVVAPHALSCIDHHWIDRQYATGGEAVCLWDSARPANEPLLKYSWGADSILSVKFNPAESCLLGSTGSDRSICLYDLRSSNPMRKMFLSMKSNKLAWNPMEPFNFVVANEDSNLYTFDMRNLEKALMIHKDHISAVMDVSFSPTGKEFVSAGYDRMIRLFNVNAGRSRDAYHTKRMQRVFCVEYSSDSKYVLSGSDDTNIRIWKSHASETVGVTAGRQERKLRYNKSLIKRFEHMPEVKRITTDVKMPKYIKKANSIRHIQNESQRRKLENRKRNENRDISLEPERKRAVIRQME